MTVLEILILSLSVVIVLPTLASFTRFDQWWIRGFDFPRIQICTLTILIILASLGIYSFDESWHYLATGLLIISLLYQFVKIFPYTPLARKQVIKYEGKNTTNDISVLVSNVLMDNKRSDLLLELIRERKPDLLLTLESNKRWEQDLHQIEDDYPYSVKVPQDNYYGMHLYSKLKLQNTEVLYLVQEKIPSIHGNVVLRNGIKIKIHCLHPMPPSPTESDTSTNRDAELLMLGRHIKKRAKKLLVFGDLNDVAWSRTTKLFLKLSGLLDPRTGRGFYNTFNANHPILRWPLDHVFHTKDFCLKELTVERHINSDHFPIFIKLNLSPEMKDKQEGESNAEPEERAWANEKIKDANPLETSF